jgi:hypothetical protein
MRTEYKIFGLVALFIYASAAFYAWYSEYYLRFGQPGIAPKQQHMDWIGVVALTLTGTLLSMCAGYFWFVARRIDLRPEDRPDGEIHEGSGEIGFFSPGSYWPVGLALAATIAGMGLVFWMVWLIVVGVIAVLTATGGLLFEYYTGSRRAANH